MTLGRLCATGDGKDGGVNSKHWSAADSNGKRVTRSKFLDPPLTRWENTLPPKVYVLEKKRPVAPAVADLMGCVDQQPVIVI